MNIPATQTRTVDEQGYAYVRTVLHSTWNFGTHGRPVTLWSAEDTVTGHETSRHATKAQARTAIRALRAVWRAEDPATEARYQQWLADRRSAREVQA